MTFFQGHEIYSIDSKGRVNIPAKMRKAISPAAKDTFTMTKGLQNCIAAYPNDEWEKVQKKLQEKNPFEVKSDYVITSILMWCTEATLDSQQRIIIPKKLSDKVGIENKVLIVGKMNHIEFWNPEEFDKFLDSIEEPYSEIVSKVMGGIN